MRIRFTIRDLLWLTLVVAILTTWWLSQRVFFWQQDHDRQTIQSLMRPKPIIPRPDTWIVQNKNGTTVITSANTNASFTVPEGKSFGIGTHSSPDGN